MTTWDEHYARWKLAIQKRGEEAHRQMQAARKRVATNTPDDWRWLEEALTDPHRRLFVTEVFMYQPVPKRLAGAMLRAGVLERDPSFSGYFIWPCVRSFGARRVLKELLRYLSAGTNAEKAGAASVLYHVGYSPRNELLDDLHYQICCQLLREFVDNSDIEVRRRIIPMLRLRPEEHSLYPEELRVLVPRAVEIARSHPDEYIRHRVEVQLGAGPPYMAIPNTIPARDEGHVHDDDDSPNS